MRYSSLKLFQLVWVFTAFLFVFPFQNCQRTFETEEFSSGKLEAQASVILPEDLPTLREALESLQAQDKAIKTFEASGDNEGQYLVLMEDKSGRSCDGIAMSVSLDGEVLNGDSDPYALGVYDSKGTCWASLFEDPGQKSTSQRFHFTPQTEAQRLPALTGLPGGRSLLIPFKSLDQSNSQTAAPPELTAPVSPPSTVSNSENSTACSFGSKGPDMVISGQTIDLRKSGSKRIGAGQSINGRRVLIENNSFVGRSQNTSNSCSAYMIDPSAVDVVIIRNNTVDMIGESPCFIDGNSRGVVFFAGWMPAHTALNKKICIENNTFKNMPQGMKMIETKTSGVVIKGNKGDGQINLRHGRRVHLENNETTAAINVMGADHTIIGNKGQIVLHQGNVTQSQIETKTAGGGSQYPYAERIKIDRSQKIITSCWLSKCPYWPTDENGKKFQF